MSDIAEERELGADNSSKKRLTKDDVALMLQKLDSFKKEKTEQVPDEWLEKLRTACVKVNKTDLEGKVYE